MIFWCLIPAFVYALFCAFILLLPYPSYLLLREKPKRK
jgi:hypothetical protein